MIVFKFGGASVQNSEHIKNISRIINTYPQDKFIVISAIGKTTNALEKLIAFVRQEKLESARNEWENILAKHEQIAKELECYDEVLLELSNVSSLINKELSITKERSYDELYDQIICVGELMSTIIVSNYLNKNKLENTWVDARELIKTNSRFRSADILWDETVQAVQNKYNEDEKSSKTFITQGFIGSEPGSKTTTLGREGSDYTAAIIAYCLDAEYLAIWKDVPGVLTADPRKVANVTLLPYLSYREAIELTYYGAQVIHPKTIQPIQQKNIPLYVKSYKTPDSSGTIINQNGDTHYPPMIVISDNQYLLEFSTKDLSFIAEHHLSMLFEMLTKYRIRVNLMRNSAVSFLMCVSAEPDRLDQLKTKLDGLFNIVEQHGIQLITIRHFHLVAVNKMKQNREVVFEEQHGITYQMVVKNKT